MPATAATPLQRYQRDIGEGIITADAAQAAAVDRLQQIYEGLCAQPRQNQSNWLSRLMGRRQSLWPSVPGAYIWGPVGRGKTYLVDTFYQCLQFPHKTRVHFHTFMRSTHQELNALEDEVNPLNVIAAEWARQYRVICLDEFHVSDITDAMLLANLLRALLSDGVTIIATSNEAPADLYRDGLQRERFIPAIKLLEKELDVFELAGEHDYRLRALEQAPVYYRCGAGECDGDLERSFSAIAGNLPAESGLIVESREIETRRHAEGIAWFDFDVLCRGPRATADYIEIARTHHTLLVSDIPVFGTDENDAARRFIHLVDEVYDRNVNLVVSAAEEPEALYRGKRLAQPFLRTASRLREMRSHEYLAREHKSD